MATLYSPKEDPQTSSPFDSVFSPLTNKVPLPVGDVGRNVHIDHLQVQQPAIVSPGAELQVALLHIERKPAHIDITGALQDACRQTLSTLFMFGAQRCFGKHTHYTLFNLAECTGRFLWRSPARLCGM